MKRLHTAHIISIVFLILLLAGSVSVMLWQDQGEARRVVVVHSYDSLKFHSRQLVKYTTEAFEKEDIKADIHHIYLSTQHNDSITMMHKVMPGCVDEIKRLNPEVVIVYDDYALDCILHYNDKRMKDVPIVYAGVNVMDEEVAKEYPLMTGFMHRIKLVPNLHLAMRYWRNYNNPTIELDTTHLDRKLLKYFQQTTFEDTTYIDNSDFHMASISMTTLTSAPFKDKVVVSFISAVSPGVNRAKNQSEDVGFYNLNSIYSFAKYMNQVQVTYNIASNSIIDHNRLPQFTAINEQFGDPDNPRFLCGYFPSVETQCKDAVSYTAAILRGTTPRSLREGEHECSFYMDYNALAAYEDVKRGDGMDITYENESTDSQYHFNFVNVPFDKQNKGLQVLCFALAVLVVAVLVALVVFQMYKSKDSNKSTALDGMRGEREKFNLALLGCNATMWQVNLKTEMLMLSPEFCKKNGLSHSAYSYHEFKTLVHKDSLPSFETWGNDMANGVICQRKLRLQLTPDSGESYHWWSIVYNITQEALNMGYVAGIIADIDDVKQKENELEEARRQIYEVEMKETFLASISHDIRTPLNAVTGFAQVLVENYDAFGAEERKEFADIVSNNSEVMLNLLLDVLNRSGRNITEIKFKPRVKSITEVVKMSYTTNRIITPAHLYLKLELPEDGSDSLVFIDPKRVEQVINNFLSNAFKFTPQGGVTMGWRYITELDEVEVYVQDTGIGIDELQQQRMFDRYYKVDEQANGTGLGLDICKTIIEKQGGTIGVVSRKGDGSRFYFRMKQYREEVQDV